MTEETLETIILGHIAKELKDEIQIGRQANLAKTIMQALRIHIVSGSLPLPKCKCGQNALPYKAQVEIDKCSRCGNDR